MTQMVETPYETGGPAIEKRIHYGARVERFEDAANRVLLVAFCVEAAEDGMAKINGLVLDDCDRFHAADSTFRRLHSRTAPLGSVALDREISRLLQEARDALPTALKTFAESAR